MPGKIRTRILGFLVFWAILPAQVRAEDIPLPGDAKFVLQLDLSALQDTEFGQRLFDMIRDKVADELSRESKHGDAPSLDKINDVLGFDPFEEIRQITLAASDYEHPEESLCAIVSMKGTTGNLEGLMLALPGYDSDEYRGHQVHSATPEDDVRVFGAIHEGRSRGKSFVFSSDRDTVESLLDYLDGRGKRRAKSASAPKGILSLEVLEFPTELIEDGPHANVARLLKDFSVHVTEEDDDLAMEMRLATQDPEQTEQLHQMMKGLVAMVELAQSLEPDDKDLQEFMDLTKRLETDYDDDAVTVSISLSTGKLMELIKEELE